MWHGYLVVARELVQQHRAASLLIKRTFRFVLMLNVPYYEEYCPDQFAGMCSLTKGKAGPDTPALSQSRIIMVLECFVCTFLLLQLNLILTTCNNAATIINTYHERLLPTLHFEKSFKLLLNNKRAETLTVAFTLLLKAYWLWHGGTSRRAPLPSPWGGA